MLERIVAASHLAPADTAPAAEAAEPAFLRCTPLSTSVTRRGMSSPKQDLWMARMRGMLKAPVLIAVGAAFDFHTGTVRQAPRWMQRSGLEWLFRLAVEPRRLWRRYVIDNPWFLFELALQKAGLKAFPL